MTDRFDTLAARMAQENRTDEVFMAERISAEALRQAHQEGRAAIVELGEGGEIIAIGVLWQMKVPGWHELGSLWVAPEHRGKDHAADIYRRRLELLPKGHGCFIISHNPRVEALASKHGFTEATVDNWLTLAPWDITCGPCDRAVTNKCNCPHRAVPGECRLFVLL
jgi:predicted N-acetyltransferase YhbS